MTLPLMPKATAVWLIDNTVLTFEQIAQFCGIHILEIKGIADGDVSQGIKGMDPINNAQLTRAELERCEQDSSAILALSHKEDYMNIKAPKKGKYTPLSKRQDRPDAIYWLTRNHPELKDIQITRLVGTTKPTIQSIRNRTHWNMSNMKLVDPVTLGLCTQMQLDEEVTKTIPQTQEGEAPISEKDDEEQKSFTDTTHNHKKVIADNQVFSNFKTAPTHDSTTADITDTDKIFVPPTTPKDS